VTETLLQSKLHIPELRSSLVRRPRLVERLKAGQECRLVLVSAPAGYGKTTLVAEWISDFRLQIDDLRSGEVDGKVGKRRSRSMATRKNEAEAGLRVAWLSLEEADNDPVRFLTYLIAAVGQVQAGFGKTIGPLLRAPQSPLPEILLTALVNELASVPKPFILALDDYHVLHSLTIHGQVGFLLEHIPPGMQLVLMTREDPLLPVARLRARGQVLEIRQEELRFTIQETANFLENALGAGLSPENVAALELRTEGWIAGLQLAALSMQGIADPISFIQAFTGSNRYVLDYLIEEVFKRQPAEVQNFLLKTAILERLSAPLCDTVVRDPSGGSQAILEQLDRSNLFIIPLDQSRAWYRYHHLFAELLRQRLHASQDHDEAGLHKRASRWFEEQGQPAEAIQHALAAGDWQPAIRLIQSVRDDMLRSGEAASLSGWYRRIPEDLLFSDPSLCLNYCWALLLSAQFESAAPLLDRLEQTMQAEQVFLGHVAAARAYLERGQGNHAGMVEQSERALRLLPKDEIISRGLVALNLGMAYWHMGKMEATERILEEALKAAQATGNTYGAITAIIFQGRVLAVRGQLKQAARVLEKALEQGGKIPINYLAYLDLSQLYDEWDDLESSRQYLEQAQVLCVRSGNLEFEVAYQLMNIRLCLAEGDVRGASQKLEKILEYIHTGKVPVPTAVRVIPAQVQVALAQGDLASAGQLEEQLPENTDTHPFYRYLGTAKAHLWLAQGRKEAARAYLAGLYTRAEKGGWKYGMLVVRLLQALAADSQVEAQTFLVEALRMGQPENFIRSFIELGEPMRLLIADFRLRIEKRSHHATGEDQNRMSAYSARLLEAFSKQPINPAKKSTINNLQSKILIEPLSKRELEVLRLVIAGLSNREIAGKLVISPGTAKTHIHNLCGKLGVRNRTEAAIKATELDLV
jgi:LuxR family maltose regulon positive regulatory protein